MRKEGAGISIECIVLHDKEKTKSLPVGCASYTVCRRETHLRLSKSLNDTFLITAATKKC